MSDGASKKNKGRKMNRKCWGQGQFKIRWWARSCEKLKVRNQVMQIPRRRAFQAERSPSAKALG